MGSPAGAASVEPIGPLGRVAPEAYVEEGIASWYGAPFNGRAASDGEIYDMRQAVAAHRTLPFGTIVRVTNLENGEQTEVRIIDRGPFVEGRVIDLSQAAARSIHMTGPGTARVRIELISGPDLPTGDFAVQVGAFADRDRAERLRARLQSRYEVFVQKFDAPAGTVFRVRVGHEPNEQAAQRLASTLASENGFQTFVVRLDKSR